jgi:hypothetical protein
MMEPGAMDVDCVHDKQYLDCEEEMDWYVNRYEEVPRYSRLFVVQPLAGQSEIMSPPSNQEQFFPFLSLPAELRRAVYLEFFAYHNGECWNHQKGGHCHCRICNGTKAYWHDRVLSFDTHDNFSTELAQWLSGNPLLQSCRQIRLEALPVLFQTRQLSIEWIDQLPMIIGFLGPAVCEFIHEIRLDDIMLHEHNEKRRLLDLDESCVLQNLRLLKHFTKLRHVTVVLNYDIINNGLHSCQSMSDVPGRMMEWAGSRALSELPLRSLRVVSNRSLRRTGTYLICEEYSSRVAECFETFGNLLLNKGKPKPAGDSQPHNRAIDEAGTTMTGVTENSSSVNLPIFNFLKFYLHDMIKRRPGQFFIGETPIDVSSKVPLIQALGILRLPLGSPSTGDQLGTCALCYLLNEHCGYHFLPPAPDLGAPAPSVECSKSSAVILHPQYSYAIVESSFHAVECFFKDELSDRFTIQAVMGAHMHLSQSEQVQNRSNAVEMYLQRVEFEGGQSMEPWDIFVRALTKSKIL